MTSRPMRRPPSGTSAAFAAIGPYSSHYGLTQREFFAVMALQGIVACPEARGTYEQLAAEAVKYADALIEALAKKE